MCLAIPGKILSIDDDGTCTVDYGAEKRIVQILSDEYKTGDYVIVSNKIVASKIPKEKAEAFLDLVREHDS